jgi:hypothetical protein
VCMSCSRIVLWSSHGYLGEMQLTGYADLIHENNLSFKVSERRRDGSSQLPSRFESSTQTTMHSMPKATSTVVPAKRKADEPRASEGTASNFSQTTLRRADLPSFPDPRLAEEVYFQHNGSFSFVYPELSFLFCRDERYQTFFLFKCVISRVT